MKGTILCCGFVTALVIGIEAQSDNYPDVREVMVPMRDGVRLQTMIVAPRDNSGGSIPFTLDRGPYGLPPQKQVTGSAGDCYRIFQNIRGRFQSGGEFVMLRPPCRPNQPKCVDETTDAWDTVDWLAKNLPNNSGRAAITGGCQHSRPCDVRKAIDRSAWRRCSLSASDLVTVAATAYRLCRYFIASSSDSV